MRIAVVTDSGPRVGLGHLRRCLTLSDELTASGATVHFVLGPDAAGLAMTRTRGFDATALEAHVRPSIVTALNALAPALVIADSYDLDRDDFTAFRQGTRLAILDDLADRDLPAELVWNGGIRASVGRYDGRVAPGTRLLVGVRYALLAREYRNAPAREIAPAITRVLVTVGGADPCGAMPMLYRAVRRALPDALIDLVLGPHVAPPPDASDSAGVVVHRAPPTLAPLIAHADLAVSAGGQTCYELAVSGVPSVIVWNADNQEPQTRELDRRGIMRCAGDARLGASVEARVLTLVAELASDPGARRAMSSAGRASLDAQGAVRTAAAILELC